ncbi:hypothetical protein [Texcoconibacillus texcoconensis]|uniref:Uncharacterized protein n=1 Tax=Texcoconibacillus texcoconensis TaxID=1095777 RepID=A0A840QSM2_9BACI|nr:hypothetical protein [Texcoconibacillus texcoconensis]MBB5174291.1 hypothetical protein [Texcoconibacillus texcoconensis]
MGYYELCAQHRGKPVQIQDKTGNIYAGNIAHVDPQYVWIEPFERSGSVPGAGYGYPGYGYQDPSYGSPYSPYSTYPQYGSYPSYGHGHGVGGWGSSGLIPVALAGIGGLALGAAFFR